MSSAALLLFYALQGKYPEGGPVATARSPQLSGCWVAVVVHRHCSPIARDASKGKRDRIQSQQRPDRTQDTLN